MLIAFSANNRRILKVKRNSNYQKWAHLLSFCCLTFVSTFITTRSNINRAELTCFLLSLMNYW